MAVSAEVYDDFFDGLLAQQANVGHTSPFDLVLDALEAREFRVRRHGAQAECRCPSHDDRNASLSVGIGSDGRALVHCHAGCDPAEIVGALGLSLSDLFSERVSNGNGHLEVVETYPYIDEAGELLYQVVRFAPKSFRQRRPDGAGGWIWNLNGTRRVLYRLPAVIEAVQADRPVWIVEGEKDVHALEAVGQVATCNSGGAGKWRPEFTAYLRGAKVVIVADRDEPGRQHAHNVARSLDGVAGTVQIVEAAAGKDASDHLGAGLGLDDLDDFVPVDAGTLEDEATAPGDTATETEAPPRFPTSDLGNAERLVAQHGDDLRYAPGLGWYTWDGRRWRLDDDGEALRRAKQSARSILAEAQQIDDDEARKAMLKWSVSSETKARLEAAVSLAESDLAVILRADQLDKAPGLLTVQNGTVELHTGELRKHSRDDHITQIVDLEYDPDARSALWEQILGRACGGDRDMAAFVQRLAGYTATGEACEDVLAFLHGPGATAKTTVIEAIKNALGEYAATADFETFLRQQGGGGVRNDIARLVGKRIVVSVEVDEGRRLAESLVKSISGGDRITARFLYREAFEFRPAFVLWLVANARPYVNAADEGIWRRIVQIPFLTVIPEGERDPTLRRKLRDPEHAKAVLTWIVKGAVHYYADGLEVPQKVREYTDEYRHESDPLADWFADCTVLDAGAQTPAKDLRASYVQWCEANGEPKPVSAQRLAAALKTRGVSQDRDRRGRPWRGIRLTARDAETVF